MSLPPIPMPGNNLTQWAQALVHYLNSLEREIEVPGPKIVQLEHARAGIRAAEDGILMWHPTTGQVIVSVNGEWHKLSYDPAVTPTAE